MRNDFVYTIGLNIVGTEQSFEKGGEEMSVALEMH